MKKRKKIIKQVKNGRVYITATFNNTLITFTDEKGNTIGWSSSGNVGFKGTRKSTPFAATSATDQVARRVVADCGLSSVEVYVKGPGSGRDAALRALKGAGLNITMIADITPIPHNGVRAKKKRRV